MGDSFIDGVMKNVANIETVESRVSEPSPVPEPSTVDTSTVDESSTQIQDAQSAAQVEPEWTPNYKFKVMDKEYEFPDYLRPVIKKENYEEIKDTYLKAYGLPHVKERAQKYEEELKQVRPLVEQYNQQNQTLEYLGSLIQKGDFATFARELNIPKQAILKYAIDTIKYDELTPEQKREYDTNIESRQRLNFLERQNQSIQQSLMHQQLQARQQQLDYCLGQAEYKDIIKSFDERAGRPGAFREEVVNRAAMLEMQTKNAPNGPTILSPQEAVEQVVKLYGPFLQSQQTVTESIPSREKPVIPNVKAGNKGPLRSKPKSLEDLKKLSRQIME